mmetsp:Transcript_72446/g.169679  ORF Transcript_72446/g.169679 Transcript_72446/m.169679 type:complete len:334 (-) Transcript_72446:44-1045(-)
MTLASMATAAHAMHGSKRALQDILTELSEFPRKVQARCGDRPEEDRSEKGSPETRLELEQELADLNLSPQTEDVSFADDPQWVSEYAFDIFSKLGRDEEETHFFSDYMTAQPELSCEERAIAVDWLVEVQTRFDFRTETLFLAVSLVDSFLALKEVARDALQLLVVAALFVAAKFEEIEPPELRDIVDLTQEACSKQRILAVEARLLTAVEFSLCRPTAAHFLDQYQQTCRCDEKQRHLLEYLLQLSLVEFHMLQYAPSEQVAAAALLCGRLMSWPGAWKSAREETAERRQRIAKCAEEMCRLLEGAPRAPTQAARQRFLRYTNSAATARQAV